MASKSSLEDSEKRIVEVLKRCDLQSKEEKFTKSDTRSPSLVAHLMGPDVRLDRNSDLISYFFSDLFQFDIFLIFALSLGRKSMKRFVQ